MKISIPKMPRWEQIGGDMNPGTYGGTIARSDGDGLELLKIQPVREYVGESEAAEVGHPFWTKEAYFDLADLDPDRKDVRSALDYIGMSLETLEADFTPTQRALVLAEALLDYGAGDEGPAGWSEDIVPGEVKWSDGTVAGAEYLADEDEEFVREVLLEDLDIDHESYGPEENDPTNGLRVQYRHGDVEITEWTDVEAATGEEQEEGAKVLRVETQATLDELFDPKGKHRETYSRDDRSVGLKELALMDEAAREEAVVAAAIAYIGYYGGTEEYVDAVGD